MIKKKREKGKKKNTTYRRSPYPVVIRKDKKKKKNTHTQRKILSALSPVEDEEIGKKCNYSEQVFLSFIITH